MKIALIGATGFVGANLLKEALQRGHEVTAIVRDPSKLTVTDQHLNIVKGDVNNVDDLAGLLKGHDLVLSAYNAGWTNPNLYADFLAGCKDIEAATVKSGVKRLIVIGGAGSLYINGAQLVDGPHFPEAFKPGATAARDYLNILKNNQELDWTFFSPAIEMHQGITTGRTGKYRLGTDEPVFDAHGKSILSGEDLAVAVIDEVENKQFLKKRFTAAY
ncbi:NAD(P)-dependent oxidoreductase [Filimonas effusa]|uniref:NAD-dependent epimerase/dehydratase family protein n=1 Tax=Filimonas effusa TaxID=2508721 RepID=A0A4Q1DBB7_9BACT|nr:NAD(P)H-binding protein [Filimonas effusa]RXK85799.1 NAD-dependent epimerase/dehydratase family protein [Filimonas effusa]